MFDIARYSNQPRISVGGMSTASSIVLGIAGSASNAVSMSRMLGTPSIQCMRCRARRLGKHGEEEGTFTARMEFVSYVLVVAIVRLFQDNLLIGWSPV